MLTKDTRLVWADSTLSFAVKGERVGVLDRHTGKHYIIGGSGRYAWLLADGRRIEEIMQKVSQTYSIDVSEVEKGLYSFLENLVKLGLLETVEGSSIKAHPIREVK